MKRAVSLFLAALMLFSFAACKSSDEETSSKSKNNSDTETASILLPYSREDGLNPFFASSLMNNALMPVLYSGLYYVDANYNAVADIASSVQTNGNRTVVTIDSGRSFTDGKSISAADVVYSFNLAKESSFYGSALTTITSCGAATSTTVEFVTENTNIYLASILTFPIVERGTADEGDKFPIGAGKYYYNSTTEGGALLPNQNYPTTFAMDSITLVNVSDSSNLKLGIVIGNVNAVFDDLSNGKSERVSAGTASVDLNNLVYIGLSKSGLFDNSKLRRALAVAIDKEELMNSGFEGYGVLTDVPFNSNWYAAEGLSDNGMDVAEAKAYIAKQLGSYTATILVNNDNDFKVKCAETLSNQLKTLGVETKIESVSYAVFKTGVANGNYDFYIGEYKLTNDMNISGLISDEDLAATYQSMLAGSITVEDFMKAFNEYQPFIPVMTRNGILAYSKTIQGGIAPLPNNPYANLAEWYL